jgi:RNA polymerase sigma factor (sigma-70 family)
VPEAFAARLVSEAGGSVTAVEIDPVAFRLLVERYQPMVRARARDLGADPVDLDDVAQESFLQAFLALERLRDPDRFAAWLAGIVLNVWRGLLRRSPVTLLPDWPEPLHPAASDGLPSADDLDRADALRAAMAGLPAGQRRAIALHYYDDLPAGQIGAAAGAARVSLHKARRRLRAYLIEHRPDLVPAASRRPQMTAVRIDRAERLPRPMRPAARGVVLADDAGGRELPVWLAGFDGNRLIRLLERGSEEASASRANRTGTTTPAPWSAEPR